VRTGAADSGGNGEDGEDGEEDIILQGWLSRQTKHAWKKEWTVVKYKYLYCYNNPEVTTCLPTIPPSGNINSLTFSLILPL